MSKEFNIFSRDDFKKMSESFNRYFDEQERVGKKFKKIKIISKRYVESKTPAQHRKYFACINELKKAFEEVGYRYDQDQIHYFIKKEYGFTKSEELPNGKVITVVKSIADKSEDVNGRNMSGLIEFIIEFAAINLNYKMRTRSNDHE